MRLALLFGSAGSLQRIAWLPSCGILILVARLCACHMAQPGTDQHNGRVAFREAAHYADTATDLPVELFNDVIDTNAISIE